MRYFNSLLYTVRSLFHQKIVRFYGAPTAPGRRQEEAYDFCQFLDIRCPVKFSYYLKFHGARTAFCWVIEGKMTSAGHRTAFAHIGLAPDDFGLNFKSYDFNGDRPYNV